MNGHDYFPTVVAACGLILLLALESWLPAAVDRRRRLRHAARNLTLGLLNAAAMALLAAPFIAHVALWAEGSRFGLLRLPNVPPLAATAAAILLFDVWMYLWHRANHELGFLWRFHRVHHSDPEMDATTAVRFHTGEILISSALRLAVIPLLGITVHQLFVYEILLLPIILFHHSNVRFPEGVDRWLRLIIVTPAIHRIHHSRLRIETDSNYSSVFSFWDRIAGTFRLRRDGQPVDFGLDEYDGETWQRLPALMLTPLTPLRGGSAAHITVVSTFTLYTIPGVVEAIRGVGRVLRPGGKLIFFELGMAPDPQVRRWQEWWEPIHHRIFEGLLLTRDIPALITQGGFRIEQMEAGYLAAFPKSCAYCWWGTAIPVRGGCDQPMNL